MKHAFSLVELSIVLVILGLLTGGILTGQNLIRAAELRAVTTEFNQFQTAISTFKAKYFALPGDMRNATDFWGAMTNCGAASPSGSGTQTCNGDGDGQIDIAAAADQTGESFAVWQHLVNAGLIEGNYSGIAGSAGAYAHVRSENVPPSKVSNGIWGAEYIDGSGGISAAYFTLNYGNALSIGENPSGDNRPRATIFTPEEAWSIDTKLDDGMPGIGKAIAVGGYGIGTNCTDASGQSDYTTAYSLSKSERDCGLIFKDMF